MKLKIYFLEERLRALTPEQMEKALADHIDLQVMHQNLKDELKRHKKLVHEQTRALQQIERTQQAASGRSSRVGMQTQAEIERLKEELRDERLANERIQEERNQLQEQLQDAQQRASSKDADTEDLEREIEALEKVR